MCCPDTSNRKTHGLKSRTSDLQVKEAAASWLIKVLATLLHADASCASCMRLRIRRKRSRFRLCAIGWPSRPHHLGRSVAYIEDRI